MNNFFGALNVFLARIIVIMAAFAVYIDAQSVETNGKNVELRASDFKNYSFQSFTGTIPIVLRNGKSQNAAPGVKYTLRKVYFFDLDGDGKDEAVAHIIANGCEPGCDSSSLFYIFTADGKRVKMLWKFAVGGDTLGGLKAVTFSDKKIILETFGNCAFENQITRPEVDLRTNPKLKTNDYTRFVFALEDNKYQLKDRTVLPWTRKSLVGYKSQIIFSNEN